MNSQVDRINPNSFGITTYLHDLRKGDYQIPTFQREVVWDRNRVKRLWDSICKFYPLGSILVWRTPTQLHNHREIGGHPLNEPVQGHNFKYLLDGQQRTTALLTSMYGGSIKGHKDHNTQLYVDLSVSEADEVEDETWQKRFLFWDEIDDLDGKILKNKGRKNRYESGLIVELNDVAHKYSDLERNLNNTGYSDFDAPEREALRRVKEVFDNYKLSFIELRGIEVVEVCQIFERINQAGQPLSMFDIVVAKTYRPKTGDKPDFYLRQLFEDFRHDLELTGSGFCSIDDMTLLQVLSVLVRDSIPNAGVHNITDRYLNQLRAEHLEQVWESGSDAVRKVFDFFENQLHLPGPALIPYRYFYMTLVSYFFRNSSPNYEILKRYFWYYSFHNEDLLSNTTHMRDHINRLHNARESTDFQFNMHFSIDRHRLRNTTYSSRGRFSRAMLALLANQEPKDWAVPDRSVLNSVYYTLTDHPNLHHIFPLDFCEKNLKNPTYANSLLNIAFLTQITNLRISNKNPLAYIRDYSGPKFDRVKHTHLLPDLLETWSESDSMPEDALDNFVEERLGLLLGVLQEYLQGVDIQIVDTQYERNDTEDQRIN